MRAGRLDRRVTIEKNTPVQDSKGEPDEVWSTLATVWAGVQKVEASERFTEEQEHAEERVTFRVRYRSDITVKMRVVHDSKNYRIEGIEEIGRQEGLFLKTVAIVP